MAAREKIISIKNGSVELTNDIYRPIGRTNENKAARLNFEFDAQFLPLINKRVVFKSAGGVLLDPISIETEITETATIYFVEIPAVCFDAVGEMEFSVYGDDADGRIFATKTQRLPIDEALNPTGGTPYATYVSIVSSALSATSASIAQTGLCEAATGQVLSSIADGTATAVALCEDRVDIATTQAELSAGSATQAANNILNGVDTHNTAVGSHADIREEIRTVEAIARGRATAFVFDTTAALNAWLAIPANVAQLVVGDNLYIRALNVKDKWWDGTQVQTLESEAPDLTNYYLKTQVDAMMPINITRTAYNALIAAGTVQAGRDYDVVEG